MKLSQKRRKTAINNNLYQLFKFESDDCRRSRTRKGTELRNAHYGYVCVEFKKKSAKYYYNNYFTGHVTEDRQYVYDQGCPGGIFVEWEFPVKSVSRWWYVLIDNQTRKQAHREVEIRYEPLRGKKRRMQ